MAERPGTQERRERISDYLLSGYTITEIAKLEGIGKPNVCKYRDQLLAEYESTYSRAKASHRWTKLAELARLKKKLNGFMVESLNVDEIKKVTDNLIKIIESEIKLLGLDKGDLDEQSELPVDLIMEVLELRAQRKKEAT
jgi:transposase-like protein